MSRQSIQKIKAMLLCIEYGILFVNTVDTKDQSNAIVPCILFVDTVDTKIKCYCVLSRVFCLSTLSIQRSKHVMHLMLCLSTLSIQRSNATVLCIE